MNCIPIERWAADIGKSPRWVRDHINSGEILALKIGASYFVTPAHIEAMAARSLIKSEEVTNSDCWDQITREAS